MPARSRTKLTIGYCRCSLIATLLLFGTCLPKATTCQAAGLTYAQTPRSGQLLTVQQVVARCLPANCLLVDDSGLVIGSGVMVHPAGVLLTNIHVIQECEGNDVRILDWQRHPFEIQGILTFDLRNDWVTIKVGRPKGDNTPISFARVGQPAHLEPGETVVAIGNGAGYVNTPSFGPVHNPVEMLSEFSVPVIRHGATITGGNSGGGLYDQHAGLMGINTMAFASLAEPASNLCFAVPINHIRLPEDTTHMLPPICFYQLVSVRSLLNREEGSADWKDAAQILLQMPSVCSAIPEAGLLLARCDIELQNPFSAQQLLGQMKTDSENRAEIAYLKGLAWTALAATDSVSLSEACDSVSFYYNFLKSLNNNQADSLLVCLRKLNDRIQLQVTGRSAEVPNNSIDTEGLGVVEHHLLGRYGLNGVRVFRFIEGVQPSSDLLQEPSLTQRKLLGILDGMRSEGVVKIDPFYRFQEPGVGSSDSAAENPAEIASFLRSLYLHELRVDREPRRAIPLIKECLKWTNDADDLETDHLSLATASSMIDNYAAAESLLTYCVTMLSPDDPIAYGNRAAVRRNMRRYREAEQDYRIALRLLEKSSVDRDSIYSASMCHYQFGLARVLLRQGRSVEARDLFQEIVASDLRWKDGPVKYPEFIQAPTDSLAELHDWKKLGVEKR